MGRLYPIFVCVPIILASLVCLNACAGMGKVLVEPGMPDPKIIIAQIRQDVESLDEFKGVSRFMLVNYGQTQSGRIAFAASLPDKLRVEMLSPFGQPLISLASNGQTMYVYIRSKDWFKSGIGSRKMMEKILGIPVSIPELIPVLAGRVPIVKHYRVQIKSWRITQNGPSSGYVLKLKSRFGRIKEKIWLDSDQKTIKKVTLYSSSGEPLYTVFPTDNTDKNQTGKKMRIVGSKGASITLEPQKFWKNAPVDKSQFVIKQPKKK